MLIFEGSWLVSTNDKGNEREVIGLLGVGLDNKDGHVRVTRSREFLLLGGSAETHERMQGTVVKLTEALRQEGKPLSETSLAEAIDMLRDVLEDQDSQL